MNRAIRDDTTLDPKRLGLALETFDLGGTVQSLEPFGSGHINSTFRSKVQPEGPGPEAEFLHQRLNEEVFRDLEALMANVDLITQTLAASGTRGLELIRTREGAAYARLEGAAWRTYRFERDTVSYNRCPGPEFAYQAAMGFGAYQASLTRLEPGSIRVTIRDFFDGRKRLEQFDAAFKAANPERVRGLESELSFAKEGSRFLLPIESAIRRGKLPPRIVHGDTKLNNLLFESNGPRVRCVVDLDTTMSAFGPYDFGDLVRFTASTAAEDETDLALVDADPLLLRALTDGWLESTRKFAAPAEHELLAEAAVLVTYLVGLRFLTDHLAGDVYFRVHRPDQNLHRARAQFQLARRLEERLRDLAL